MPVKMLSKISLPSDSRPCQEGDGGVRRSYSNRNRRQLYGLFPGGATTLLPLRGEFLSDAYYLYLRAEKYGLIFAKASPAPIIEGPL